MTAFLILLALSFIVTYWDTIVTITIATMWIAGGVVALMLLGWIVQVSANSPQPTNAQPVQARQHYSTPASSQLTDKELMRRLHSIIENALQQHGAELLMRKHRLARSSTDESWHGELRAFCNAYLLRQIETEFSLLETAQCLWRKSEVNEHPTSSNMHSLVREWLCQCVDARARQIGMSRVARKAVEEMSALEFEDFCAVELKKAGWDTRLTDHTNDQGADIIAEKSGKKAVIQCKLYSKSVGNSAVQEVNTARSFYRAQVAVVVSNASYTPGARDAAKACEVRLLHYTELDSFR